MKCNEAISGIFCYNLLAETLIVFGLIANYLVERIISFVKFVLQKSQNTSFTYKISMNVGLEKKVDKRLQHNLYSV